MNMHVITPTDIKESAIKSYSEMLLKPLSKKHEKFLKNSIKQLQNDNSTDNILSDKYCGNHFSSTLPQRLERI
jgi:type III secretory pathway component EscR